MIDITLLAAVFLVGLNGSLHCVGMCGPIVGILGMNTEADTHRKRIGTAIFYNLGRISTYVILGFVAMLLSIAMQDLKPLQIVIRYFSGVIMLFVALQLIGFPQYLAFIEKPLNKLSRPISQLTRKFFPIKSLKGAYVAGLAWGLLPCGMVYMAFAMSLGVENVLAAPLVMLFFGLGTLPMMLTLSVSGNFFGSFFSSPKARKISGVLVLAMTIFYMGSMLMSDLGIGGGHDHHGHGMMDHSQMDHSQMDHSGMDHAGMGHEMIDHSAMGHSEMDHSTMDHKAMDHTMDHTMEHQMQNHSETNHDLMDHSQMNH
ncbi:sulfite exporter TauE/SafE family protein [Ignatzschineria sp. F8392]|uniref:sulfite exporter TauE/SafE family protein n=1 Tax=Ignatzschineria sp. F8392 TaxID=1980117 RepID=UPI000B98A8BE|nr:sulfite exporter TauE/SafE family protein [Ignatzschineria sp. F8392]